MYEPENENEEEDSVLSPTIEVELKEPGFCLELSRLEVNFGVEASIHCNISNCPEKCEFYWEKINGKNEINELPTSYRAEDKYYCESTKDFSTLTIKNMDKDDVAFYRCCIKSCSSENEFRFKSHRKKVYILNEPDVEMKIHSIDVYIGGKVSIGCVISHSPRDFEVFWEKIDIDDDKKSYLIEINDQTKEKYEKFTMKYPHLTIKNAQKSDDAFYCCGIKYLSSSGDLVVKSEWTRLHVLEEKKTGETKIEKQFNIHANKIVHLNTGVGEVHMNTDETKESSNSNQSSSSSGSSDSNADDKMGDTSSTASESKPTTTDNSRDTAPKNGQTSSDIDINLQEKPQLKIVPPKEDFSFSEMERIAVLKGFVVKNVCADGNCMFHAISHYIGDQISTRPLIAEEKAKELRRKIVQYLEKNDTAPQGDKYSSFLEDEINDQKGDKWSKYLNSMKQQGTYGDEIILRAISHHFSVQILVLSTESPKRFLNYDPAQPNEQTKTIHLGFMHENRHYVRLEKKERMDQQSSTSESTV
ncbi:uncharacterized protein LOC127738811 [Mytilus californianus]|uniref:uncharacterized protein LOC127738811 n=1 Tax=Mytilus californianus TaxID=6549 RepID=UPI002247BA75|nr:uncharacterized protein LOC127738811 [Mytilus californianus]